MAFIVNRSFIDSRTFDGFRKLAAQEYTHIYIVDLGGDVRANPKLSGPKHNVFAIQAGVAIAFLVRQTSVKQRKAEAKAKPAVIEYTRRPEMDTAYEKLQWLATTRFENIEFERIRPDEKHNWLDQAEHNWEDFLPVADKQTKQAKVMGQEQAIFKFYSTGVSTNRDEWVTGLDRNEVSKKMIFFIEEYGKASPIEKEYNSQIKWSRNLKRKMEKGKRESFSKKRILRYSYRPFCNMYFYESELYVDEEGINTVLRSNVPKKVITISNGGKNILPLATDNAPDLHFNGDSQCLPLYRYSSGGERIDNIADFALKAFRTHYKIPSISREDIFHYVYGVLHHPAYREKYALNLKQEFPRVPFYADFGQWVAWGRELMDLHIGFETVTPYALERHDTAPKNDTPEALALAQKAKLKVVRDAAKVPTGVMELDGLTKLSGVPAAAWAYRLGNRSALEWVLERHKETTPKDPTIREKFNTYRFADHKERVIDLLAQVTTVSVETMRILGEMPAETI